MKISVVKTPTGKGRRWVMVKINDTSSASMLLDTGSDLTIVSRNKAVELGIFPQMKHVHQKTKCLSASGSHIRLLGKVTNVSLEIEGRILLDTVWVAEKLCDSAILGRSSLEQLEALSIDYGGPQPALRVAAIEKVKRPKIKVNSALGTDYSHLANRKVFDIPAASWKIPPVSLIPLVPDSKPIVTPSRRYSTEDREFISSEVTRLLKEGKIQPSHSSYRSQVVVVRREDGKRRLAIDYASTINPQTERDAYPIPLIQDLLDQASKWTYFSKVDLSSAYHQIPLDPAEQPLTAFEANGQLYEFTHVPLLGCQMRRPHFRENCKDCCSD